jgi:polyferredoxin
MSGFLPPPMIVMAAAMMLFTVVGNKVFCGWICPLGSLQEIVLKLSRPIKKIKLPFSISNSVRFSLFLLFLIYLISFGTNIYNLFNPFELFHWHLDTYLIIVTAVVILASLIYYRPFCHFLCPAGLITWFFEQVSIFKVIKNETRCTHCNKCIKESPCSAIDPIIKDQTIIPDCYACGKCIESCQVDALSFSLK